MLILGHHFFLGVLEKVRVLNQRGCFEVVNSNVRPVLFLVIRTNHEYVVLWQEFHLRNDKLCFFLMMEKQPWWVYEELGAKLVKV